MTFLLFVCHELLGPPKHGSCWHCPYCDPDADSDWVSFSVRPPKEALSIKFKCHRCQKFGDEHDLLRLIYPGDDNRDERRLRLAEMRETFLREHAPPPSPAEVAQGKRLLEKLRARSSIAQRGTGKPQAAKKGKA